MLLSALESASVSEMPFDCGKVPYIVLRKNNLGSALYFTVGRCPLILVIDTHTHTSLIYTKSCTSQKIQFRQRYVLYLTDKWLNFIDTQVNLGTFQIIDSPIKMIFCTINSFRLGTN